MPSPSETTERRGRTVEYVPHDVIARYDARYRVEDEGQVVRPPAADDPGIPLDEIWVSEKWWKCRRFVLYHELREIEHRAAGRDRRTAHERAERDERAPWWDDPRAADERRVGRGTGPPARPPRAVSAAGRSGGRGGRFARFVPGDDPGQKLSSAP